MARKRKIKRSQKIKEKDIQEIVRFIQSYELENSGYKLTWMAIEKISGYTRAALNGKKEIKDAYLKAKKAGRGGRKPGTSNKNSNLAYLQNRLRFAKEEAEKYKKQIEEYQKLYQRVAYNLMASDLGSIDRLNSNLPEEPMQLDQETLEKIVKIIFKPLPPRQRR